MPSANGSPHALPPSPGVLRRVRRSLLAWYAAEHRDFPWRRTSDGYAVLVSEVMLQQTQASRVAERFPRFMSRFPTAEALSDASDAAVLVEWSGLGYNRRALALRAAAREIVTHGWPTDVAGLERLPGVGPYTARALASLAFGLRVGVVDTNVRRWLVRRFGPALDGGAAATGSKLQGLADGLARSGGAAEGPDAVAAWTHATMEFGARICASRTPRCDACPIARECPARHRAVRVPVVRQPAFAGSPRALRGAILRRLAATPGHALPVAALDTVEEPMLPRALAQLAREGLVHMNRGLVRLGGNGEDGVRGAPPRDCTGSNER